MTDDKDKPKSGTALVSLPPGVVSRLSAVVENLGIVHTSRLGSIDASVQASSGSIAIAGNNTGSIVNVNAGHITIAVERQIARELPSYLSRVVAKFSEDMSEYDTGPKRTLPPEVSVKLAYNDFPPSHSIITNYFRYSNVLEATYRGIEQRNDDARRMVRHRAAFAYSNQLSSLCVEKSLPQSLAHTCARGHAVYLVNGVIEALLAEFAAGNVHSVMQETAHLAVCLIVADAVIECEVLERPVDAITS